MIDDFNHWASLLFICIAVRLMEIYSCQSSRSNNFEISGNNSLVDDIHAVMRRCPLQNTQMAIEKT